MATEKATFAAGCFWRPQLQFRDVPGVVDATVGYTGGDVEQPTYEMVCSASTGHAEAVDVTFDSDVISYDALLDFFFSIHDPTQVDRQGPDIGPQYRSAVFVHDESQQAAAEKGIERAQQKLGRPVATRIEEATDFWVAEDYHQWFLEKKGIRYQ